MITANVGETRSAIANMLLFKNRSGNVYSKFLVGGDVARNIYPREFSHGNCNYNTIQENIWADKSYFSQFSDPYSVGIYIVYSYGSHYPMFIFDMETKHWFANDTRVSPTTSKHRTQLSPTSDMVYMDTDHMKRMVILGSYNALTQHRLGREAA